jgi:hypothetical protein
MVEDRGDDMGVTWEQVRVAAGDVQLVVLSSVIARGSVARAQIPKEVETQTIVDGLEPTGVTNLQDIADRLARHGVMNRSDPPVIFTPTRTTHRLYDLLSPALNRGRGPIGYAPAFESTSVTLHVLGQPFTDALDELLSSVRSLQAGEAATLRLVRAR